MRLIFTFCTIFIFFSTTTFGQKADLKKAAQFFKEKKYATAIPFYKKALAVKSSLNTKTKLAFCYKATNQTAEAAILYAKIVQHERAKEKTWFYFAETLMSTGKYEEAKIWFKKYAQFEPDDEETEKMIASCDYAKTIPAYFGNVVIKPFSQNSDEDDNAPVFWNEGIAFTSDRKGKLKLLDTKSGATGRSYLHLYHSKRLNDGTFAKPKEYISKINDARKNTGMASFQVNNGTLFFTRNGAYLSRQNAYCLQLFEAKSVGGQRWKGAKILPFCSKEYNFMHPAVSPDGKLLFFVSDKPRGIGGTDIYVSKKTKKGWSKPDNLGKKINTMGHEGFPFMHQNGKLYFCSKGHLGLGGFDIFVTEMDKNGEWKTPINLGRPINSPADDISIFLDKKVEKGLFTSSREGGDDDIFLLLFPPKSIALNQQPTLSVTNKIEDNVLPEMDIEDDSIADSSSIIEERLPEKKEKFTEPKTVKTASKPETTANVKNKTIEKTDFLQQEGKSEKVFKKGVLFSLPTIQFAEGEYFVTFKIAKELDQVAKILKKHPSLKIELASHTANLGNYKERMTITRNRAAAIKEYLERKGIGNNVLARGFGGQQPLNNCLIDIDCSIENHTINDRIEVKILSNW